MQMENIVYSIYRYQNPGRFRKMVGRRRRKPMMISARMNFPMKRNHFAYWIPETDRTAIRTPEHGVIILVNPSPNWKARTVA